MLRTPAPFAQRGAAAHAEAVFAHHHRLGGDALVRAERAPHRIDGGRAQPADRLGLPLRLVVEVEGLLHRGRRR
jgi:hypothetical protein